VVAPKAKPAPSPIAPQANPNPSPVPANGNNQVIQQPPQFLRWLGSLTLKLAAGTCFVLVSGLAGWAVMNSVIRSTPFGPLVKRSPINLPINSPSNSPSSSERTRMDKLLSRREALGVNEASFYAQVDQLFYAKHPELKGRQLTSEPEDTALREEWYKIAEKLLVDTPRP
jgi:serine/threonine-protein kinase